MFPILAAENVRRGPETRIPTSRGGGGRHGVEMIKILQKMADCCYFLLAGTRASGSKNLEGICPGRSCPYSLLR